jgi:hypothetical protein
MSREGQKGGHDPQKRIENTTESPRTDKQPYASETDDYGGGHLRTPDPAETKREQRGSPSRKG